MIFEAEADRANGQWLQTYTIIITEANELMAPVHNRMPVILHPSDFNRCLDREPQNSTFSPICICRSRARFAAAAVNIPNGRALSPSAATVAAS
jgi:putative SOS response-associated peptidase YedK